MLVLLTRALDEGMRTATKLAANGHRAVLSPVLDMVPTGAEWPRGVVGGVLATSAQAFELFSDTPDWPLPEARRLMPLFLVGERTRDAARERGFEGPATIAPDAKELAASVAANVDASRRLVYLAGRDRKPDLEKTLAEAGKTVETIEVYSAQAAEGLSEEAIGFLDAGEIGAVLHYSRRSAEIFLDLARQAGVDVSRLPHVSISSDAASPLRSAGLNEVHVAEKPNEQAVLALVAALAAKAKTSLAHRDARS